MAMLLRAEKLEAAVARLLAVAGAPEDKARLVAADLLARPVHHAPPPPPP